MAPFLDDERRDPPRRMPMKLTGAIAAGHEQTAEAARVILQAGGNAFDAIIGAAFAACVAEPVLISLGGGGFLLARESQGSRRIYDFFVQTPRQPPRQDVDFYPILADFGTATQEFHIGMGSVATPGVVRGLFAVHRDLGRMPMRRIVEPAIALAREGVEIMPFQRYLFDVVEAIYAGTPSSRLLYASRQAPGRLVQAGEHLRLPELADTLEALAIEGDGLFYRGEIARLIARHCTETGGLLTLEDLEDYRAEVRRPLDVSYRDVRLLMNPPPSCGGILTAFALSLLEGLDLHALGFGTAAYLSGLAEAMALTNKARMEHLLAGRDVEAMAKALFEPAHLEAYRQEVQGRPASLRGTTHMNVADGRGNVASMTISNGEGCGHVLPGTGIMLNNMLGEEDLNPGGFHRWRPNQRMSSMMMPTLLLRPDGTTIATGSGGSNRIRTAVLQVLLNLIDFRLPPEEAVASPRIHYEDGLLSIEGGFSSSEVERLSTTFAKTRVWQDLNLFFGGAHTVSYSPQGPRFEAVGDPRRAGVALII
jgi:gamma-glutamyltranspeptidase/glutathione hydrolase